MKRVLAVLLCLICALFLLVACGDDNVDTDSNQGSNNNTDNQGHTHTYKTNADWTKDASGHWYDPTCDCEDAPITKLNHVDANNDGACDVCTYTNHEHEYSEEWTADCTNHWNAADCGHTVAGTNVEAHKDENKDGRCDVCNYIIEDLHQHYYSSEWTNDAEYHWHAALCEHKVEVADKAAHVVNDAGICTECNATVKQIDKTNILAILAAAIASNNKVVTGDVKLEEIVYDGSEANGTLTELNSATSGVYFVLGDGQSYYFLKNYNAAGELIGGEQQWYETLANGDVFGVKMDVNAYTLDNIMGDPAKFSGYTYQPGSILAAGYDDTNTLAQTLYNFYDLMSKGVNVSNATENYDAETGKYSFSFSYFTVNELTSGGEVYDIQLSLYETEIEFTVDDNFVIDVANFQVKVYNYYDGGKAENDLTYDKETNTVSKTADANPSYYKYTVYQTSGERTFTTPYPKASLVPTGFDFFYVTDHEFPNAFEWVVNEEILVGDTITIPAGTYAYFHLGNPVPSTTNFDFIDTSDFTFTFVNNNPNMAGRAWYMDPGSVDEMLNGYSAYIGCLKLKLRDAGEYTVTIGFGDLTKTFTLIIPGEEIPSVEPDTEEQLNVLITDNNTFTVDYKEYKATLGEGKYTFTIPAGLGAIVDGEDNPRVDFNTQANGGKFTLELEADEVVKIYFGAATKYSVHAVTVQYEACDVEDDEIDVPAVSETPLNENGNNQVNGKNTAFAYTASVNGVLTIKYGGIAMGSDADYVVYTVNGGNATTVVGGNVEHAINLNAGDKIVITVVTKGYATIISAWEGEESDEPANDYNTTVVEGSNTLYFSQAEISADKASRPLTITVAGNYSFNSGNLFVLNVTDAEGNTYTKNDDYTITLVPGEYFVNFSMLSMFGVPADVAQTLNLENTTPAGGEGGDEGGEAEKDDLKETLHLWMPNNGTYDFMFLTQPEGYFVNIYNSNFDMFFTYDLENNGDGSYNMTVAYAEKDGFTYNEGYATVVEATVFVLYYDGIEWSMDGEGGNDEPTGDPLKEAVLGTYVIDGYEAMVYNSYTDDGYLVNVYGEGFDLYFTFEVTDNGDGSYKLTLTYLSRPDFESGVDKVDEILALDMTVTPGGSEEPTEGTSENPYIITEPGEYMANFPEGYSPIWFAYTVTDNGYVTISTEYANPWFQIGTSVDFVTANRDEMDNILKSVTIYALAGQTVYISVGDYDFVAADVEFTVAFEAFSTESSSHLAGNWTGAEADNWGGSINYQITIDSNGTGSGTADYGYFQEAFDITFILVNGNKVTLYTVTTGDWGGAQGTIELSYAEANNTLSNSTLTLTKGGAVVTPANKDLVIGNNAIEAKDETFVYTAGKDITINLSVGGAVMGNVTITYSVNDGDAVALELNSNADVDLKSGDKLTVTVVAAGYATITASEKETVVEPDGTQGNPFIVGTLPFTFSHTGKYDLYYKLVATEDATIVISYPQGGYISGLPSNAVKDSTARTYTLDVKAGDVIVFNPWTLTNPTTAHEYVVKKADQVVTPDPEEPGEGEGGETTVVEYVSERHTNGRYIKFSINGDTMTITRSNMSGGWDASTATAVYTLSGSGADTVATWVSGTVCTFIFDANGLPTQIAWAGAAYVNFAIAE